MSEDGNKRLGRGLSALLGEEAEDYAALDRMRSSKEIPVEYLKPNPYQPRYRFDETELQSLVESIKDKGILQPILVRRIEGEANTYEIIAGERRWRAAQAAKLHQVPVIIREFNDEDALEIALVENLQRQDLTPIEEAQGYKRLLEEFSLTQDQVSKRVGKSRSHVANMMRLLGLPEEVREMLDDGRLSAGHARALVSADEPLSLARQIVAGGFNVRQAEKLSRRQKSPSKSAGKKEQKDADTLALEGDLSAALGLKVTIHHHGDEGGDVRINYRTLEQLDEVCRRLCHQSEDEVVEDNGEFGAFGSDGNGDAGHLTGDGPSTVPDDAGFADPGDTPGLPEQPPSLGDKVEISFEDDEPDDPGTAMDQNERPTGDQAGSGVSTITH